MTRRDDWLLHQLPVGMAEDEFLGRFVSIFQEVADTVVGQIDNLPHVFDATVAPPSMVRTLGTGSGSTGSTRRCPSPCSGGSCGSTSRCCAGGAPVAACGSCWS